MNEDLPTRLSRGRGKNRGRGGGRRGQSSSKSSAAPNRRAAAIVVPEVQSNWEVIDKEIEDEDDLESKNFENLVAFAAASADDASQSRFRFQDEQQWDLIIRDTFQIADDPTILQTTDLAKSVGKLSLNHQLALPQQFLIDPLQYLDVSKGAWGSLPEEQPPTIPTTPQPHQPLAPSSSAVESQRAQPTAGKGNEQPRAVTTTTTTTTSTVSKAPPALLSTRSRVSNEPFITRPAQTTRERSKGETVAPPTSAQADDDDDGLDELLSAVSKPHAPKPNPKSQAAAKPTTKIAPPTNDDSDDGLDDLLAMT